jgi:hypothetical protein
MSFRPKGEIPLSYNYPNLKGFLAGARSDTETDDPHPRYPRPGGRMAGRAR